MANGSAFLIGIAVGSSLSLRRMSIASTLRANRWRVGNRLQLGDLTFDPEARLITVSDSIDIATFSVSAGELTQIGKQPFAVPDGDWPPPHPSPTRPGHTGLTAYFAGFPEDSRLWINSRAISFGLYIAGGPMAARRIARSPCPLRDSFGSIPWGSDFLQKASTLGASAAVRMMPLEKDGSWSFHLAGVIVEFPSRALGVETVIAAPAHYIAADGSINENSAPIRFVGPSE